MGFLIWLLILFLILVDHLVVPTLAQCSPKDFCWICSDTSSYTNGSEYEQNLRSLFSSFSSSPTQNQANSGFFNSSLGEGSEKVNAIAMCRGDVGLMSCGICLKNNTNYLLQTCLFQKEATLWAPHCTVRYSPNLIFGIEKDGPSLYVPNPNNVSNAEEFERVLNPVLQNLSYTAASGDSVRKFAAGDTTVPAGGQMIYALVQCTPDLDKHNCSKCLEKAMSDIPGHIGAKQGGRVFKPSCTLWYEDNLFYELASDSIVNISTPVTITPPVTQQGNEGKKSKTAKSIIIIIVVVTAFVTMLFTGICIFLIRVKQQRAKLESDSSEKFSFEDSLQYDFEMIKSATDDFSDANKLGQGGFGVVYKGILLNGQHINVKRLSKSSEQGDCEFKNEVMLLNSNTRT